MQNEHPKTLSLALQRLLLPGLLMAAGASHGAVFIVNNTADIQEDSPGNGTCNPVGAVGNTCTLRAAIQEANALAGPDSILIASGTYPLTRTGAGEDAAFTGDLDITSEITLVNGTSNPPDINGITQDRVFDVHEGGVLTLDNVIVRGGYANQPGTVHGGAIRVNGGAELTLQSVSVATNVGNIGGGIYNDGIVQILDSEFVNNAITAENVAVEFADGAAILNRGVLQIENTTFRANGVVPGGEGLVVGAYAIESREGFAADPEVVLLNSTLVDNTNGIFSDGVPTELVHATIARNGQRGLRFLRDLGALGEVQLRVNRSVIIGHDGDCNGLNTADAEYDLSNRSNASGDETCGFTGGSDQQNIGWPFFGPLDIYDSPYPVLMPTPGGPLVDAAGALCPPFLDQRGKIRPLDGDLDFTNHCDIGAVEYDPDSDPIPQSDIFADGFED